MVLVRAPCNDNNHNKCGLANACESGPDLVLDHIQAIRSRTCPRNPEHNYPEAIQRHLRIRRTSPMTNMPVAGANGQFYFPNLIMKQQIQEWQE